MTVDEEAVRALVSLLDGTGPDGVAVAELYERMIDAAFRAFMLSFRKNTDRPMTEEEYTLTNLAFTSGWMEGVDLGLRLAAAAGDEEEPGA